MHQEAQLYLPELWKVSLKGCTEKERNIIYKYNYTNKGYLGALALAFAFSALFNYILRVPYNQIHIYPILISTDLLTEVLHAMPNNIPKFSKCWKTYTLYM